KLTTAKSQTGIICVRIRCVKWTRRCRKPRFRLRDLQALALPRKVDDTTRRERRTRARDLFCEWLAHVRQRIAHHRHTRGIFPQFLGHDFVERVSCCVMICEVSQSVLPNTQCGHSLVSERLDISFGRLRHQLKQAGPEWGKRSL